MGEVLYIAGFLLAVLGAVLVAPYVAALLLRCGEGSDSPSLEELAQFGICGVIALLAGIAIAVYGISLLGG